MDIENIVIADEPKSDPSNQVVTVDLSPTFKQSKHTEILTNKGLKNGG